MTPTDLDALDQACSDVSNIDQRRNCIAACCDEAAIPCPSEDCEDAQEWRDCAESLASAGWINAATACDAIVEDLR